jgi:transcription elongation factor GreA
METLRLSAAGLDEIRSELERLYAARAEGEQRLAESMQLAGDAGELGEHLDVQRDQDLLERRIALLEDRVAAASEPAPRDVPLHDGLVVGLAADLEDLDTGERSHFELVSSAESNPSEGRLSIESPVGKAIVGHHPGDTIEVLTPKGHRRHLKVLAVS